MYEFNDDKIAAYVSMPKYFCPESSGKLAIFTADNGNHFLNYGIVEGMFLVFDLDKKFKAGHLSCYHNKNDDGRPEFKVSDKNMRGYEHIGRLVLTLRNYEA